MNAGAALGGVQAEAGLGLGVVGDLGAAVGVDGGVGFAGGDDLEAARGKQRTKPHAEGQGEVFSVLAVGEAAAGVVAAVGGIEHDDEAGVGAGGADCEESTVWLIQSQHHGEKLEPPPCSIP